VGGASTGTSTSASAAPLADNAEVDTDFHPTAAALAELGDDEHAYIGTKEKAPRSWSSDPGP
jgi:hypothetical protein